MRELETMHASMLCPAPTGAAHDFTLLYADTSGGGMEQAMHVELQQHVEASTRHVEILGSCKRRIEPDAPFT